MPCPSTSARRSIIGSTIHFVDVGIDTGDILEVVPPPIYPMDNAEKLYCRAEKLAIHRLAAWIEHLNNGGALPRFAQEVRTPLNRTRDRKPYHDAMLWVRRKLGFMIVPYKEAPPMPPIKEVTAAAGVPPRPAAMGATA